MADTFNKTFRVFQKTLVEHITIFEYRQIRYKINFCIVLFYSRTAIDIGDMQEHLRKSDRFIPLDSQLFAFVLDNCEEEAGIKTSNKILSLIQAHYFPDEIYATVVSSGNYSSVFQMVHDLFDLVEYALHHGMNNLVIDSSKIITIG